MNRDKLAWLRQPVGHTASGAFHSGYTAHRTDALKAALRAQLMHVAIGFTRGPRQPKQLLVDLCVYVSMAKPEIASYLDAARAMVLIEAEKRTKPQRGHDYGFIKQTGGRVMITTDMCTASPIDLYDHVAPVIGEPMTLQILVDTRSERTAHLKATQLCDRFRRWEKTETTLPSTVERIQNTLVERSVDQSIPDDLFYTTASISAGWTSHTFEAGSLLWCGAGADENSPHRLPAALKEYCFHTFEQTWKDVARHTGLFDAGADETQDESADDDVGNDFVDAGKLMGALFGDRPRRKLR